MKTMKNKNYTIKNEKVRRKLKRFCLIWYRRAIVFSFFALFTRAAFAETQWTGSAGDSNWGTAGNWSPATVPNAPDAIVIFGPSVSGNQSVNINGNFELGIILLNTTYDLSFSGSSSQSLNFSTYFTPPEARFLITNSGTNIISAPVNFPTDGDLLIDMTPTRNLTISGLITTGGLRLTDSGTLTISGTSNVYSGPTTINPPPLEVAKATLLSGAINSFSPNSPFVVNGFLGLNGFSNNIYSLEGSGLVTLSAAEILTIANGGTTFSGQITGGSGGGGITLSSGTLTLTPSENANDYVGTTLINSGATLQAGNTSAFSPNSSMNVNGTLALNGFSNTISALEGAATGSVTLSSGETLTLTSGGLFFYGQITGGNGSGGLTLAENSGTSVLAASGSAPNNYAGTTLINSGAILQANDTGALSSNSLMNVVGTLYLNLASNTVNSLFGNGSVSINGSTLTISSNGGSFSGAITGTGALILSGGTLELSGTGNTYSGATTIDSGAILEAGIAGGFSSASNYKVDGTLDLNSYSNTISSLAGTGTVRLSSGATLTIANGGTTFSGQIKETGGITLDTGAGILILSASGIFPNNYAGTTLIKT